MRALAAVSGLLLGAFVLVGACVDPGVVGTRSAPLLCEPACMGDQLCHPDFAACVQCIDDLDCTGNVLGAICDPARNQCSACVLPATCTDADDEDCECDEGDGGDDDVDIDELDFDF